MVRLDGLYRVTTATYCAGFEVTAGHVTAAAPILRKRVLPRWEALLAGSVAIVGCRPPKVRSPEANRVVTSIGADLRRFVAALPAGTTVVSGGARGVDSFAWKLATERGLVVVECLPDAQRYDPKVAPLMRNTTIVALASRVECWPGPWSRGTYDTLRKARESGKPAVEHRPWLTPAQRAG